MFRTRGAGISSDIESTIVPAFLAEMDGVEELKNVVVIGATNRQDLIDPAVLRPGRFDLKVKVDRPSEEAGREVLAVYIVSDLPWGNDSNGKPYVGQKEHSVMDRLRGDKEYKVDLSTPELVAKHVINVVSDYLYYCGPPLEWTDRRGNKHEYNAECVELTYNDGEKKRLYIKDLLVSGAMIESIITKAKKSALKRLVLTGEKGIKMDDFYAAIRDEIKENNDLPNSNNPDDWAKILGQHSEKGSRLVSVRPIIGTQQVSQGKKKVEVVTTGHYL
jgi:proteasome-associated ATPase